jgi:hypothetical protein
MAFPVSRRAYYLSKCRAPVVAAHPIDLRSLASHTASSIPYLPPTRFEVNTVVQY